MSFFQNVYGPMLDRYKFALLCELDNCIELENEIRHTVSEKTETHLSQIQAFALSQKALLHQAFESGKQGIEKESSEFQGFLDQIKAENDPILTEAVLSWYDKGFSQYEPFFPIDSIAEAILGNSFKQFQETEEILPLMEKILTFRTWLTDPGKQRELKEAVERIRELDPQKGIEAQQLLAQGREISKLQNQAYRAGQKNDEKTFADLKKQARKAAASQAEIGNLFKQFNKGKKNRAISEKKQTVKIDIPQYDFSTKHPFFIGNLQEENHWRIFVDETGQYFDEKVFSAETKEKDKGKLVALFVPQNTSLPALTKHHATSETTEKNQQVLADLFTKGKNCGLLGVTLENMAPVKDQNYWYAVFERLFDITLRLLPVSDQPVTLEFFIENRGEEGETAIAKTAAILRQISDLSLLHLGKSFPEKANLFTLKINCIAKNQTADQTFLAYNGYVDTVACAWSRGRKELYNMLRDGGFLHRCLLDDDIQEFPAIMDRLTNGEKISVEQWNKLLSSPDEKTIDSPVNMLLMELGSILRRDIRAWEFYVDAVLVHLDSKAIRLNLLGKQINWLTAHMPAEAEFPKRLKIIWLTAKLAEENHKGTVAEKLAEELEHLLPSMFLEDAPLCCWSVLHQAVTQTNAFRFDAARNTIYRFSDVFGLIDHDLTYNKLFPDDQNINPALFSKAAVIGLRYYGQMLSSLGQHCAFVNDFRQANEYFLCALKCFSLLSDGGFGDIGQTSSYWITNYMDHIQNPQDMIPQIEKYLGASLMEAVERMVSSKEPADKYRHHILLRYFQLLPGDHPAVKKYLDFSSGWKVDAGHPWEMIEFYRALLTEDETLKFKHLYKAAEIAEAGGPTLRIIASVIWGSIYFYDRSVKERYEQFTGQTISELPDIGEHRINALYGQLTSPLPPREFARKVLPFNFR